MRKLVLQMMTTLNGRLDNPFEWVSGVGEDHYRAIETLYQSYDTILVGGTTFEEMVGYWPGALESGEGTESNRRMAQHMHDYRKLVFSRDGKRVLAPWHNSELAVAPDDAALVEFVTAIKAQPGRDIQLSGGASLAQSLIGLGLVDRFHFFVYPTVSTGMCWFDGLQHKYDLEMIGTTGFQSGVVQLSYAAGERVELGQPQRFTELLT